MHTANLYQSSNAAQTMDACLDLMARLRAGGTFRKLRPVLYELLQDHLPDDAHERCRGNTFVNTTRLVPCAPLPSSYVL